MQVCLHHNDLDGFCSAAVIGYFNRKILHDIPPTFIEMDYNRELDLSLLTPNCGLYIVDYSLKEDVMEKVLAITTNIVWIDHHKTAMERKYITDIPGGIPGLRGNDFAACEYTWKYMDDRFNIYDEIPHEVPLAVKLISDRDNWNWKFGAQTKLFNAGMMTIDSDPHSDIWGELFIDESKVIEVMGRGKILIDYQEITWRNVMNGRGFEVEFEGHKCFAINVGEIGSEAFGQRFYEYDICISFKHTGKNWMVSLYSNKKVDVSEIAKKYGGGGHASASGFTLAYCPVGLLFKEVKIE
jgi:oligoribonuclease NrnB/cAMP/cGMP phosphodiesterase (DHH superfamily)